MRRRPMLAVLLTLAGCSTPRQPVLRHAVSWLWSRQEADGGWHSHTYGLLRSGQALTPFVLEALLEAPEEVYPQPRGQVDRALAFIRQRTRSLTAPWAPPTAISPTIRITPRPSP